MLRRIFLIRIGLLVACFVAGAVVAVSLLQATIPQTTRLSANAATLIDGTDAVMLALEQVQYAEPGAAAPSQRLEESLEVLGKHPAVAVPASPQSAALARLLERLPTITGGSDTERRAAASEARGISRELAIAAREHVAAEQASFARYLRNLMLALTLAALVMVNVAIIVLLRTAQVVLKPVGALLEGSRELEAEHFEHRVHMERQDEFSELAAAHNRLAEHLAKTEERKAETLRLLGVALNHDLNNALATMEMQLSLLDRQSGRDSGIARCTRDIQSTLNRMNLRVASLKNIRRVVLTDYIDGQKMVDLEQSTVSATPLKVQAG